MRIQAALVALLLGAAACRSGEPAPEPATGPIDPGVTVGEPRPGAADEPTLPEATDARQSVAIEHILAGDYESARLVLDQLLTDSYLEEARVLLDQGIPEDALILLDKALAMSRWRVDARLLKADGSLQLAEKKIESGGSAGLIEGALEDALNFYSTSGDSTHSLFGASRSAYLLGRYDEALEFARRGMAVLEPDETLEPLPQRTWSEAAFMAYVDARQNEAEAEVVQARYASAEEALESLLGHAADDAYVWATLSDLYEWDERFAQSRTTLEMGLQRLPEEPGLLQRLARVTRKEGDSQAVIAVFASYTVENPRAPLGYWYLGVETFDEALTNLLEGQGDIDAFTRAEEAFQACRQLDPANEEDCMGYELLSRYGRGRVPRAAGDLDAATREFLSMNELRERGIEWNYPGKLADGVNGLYFVADAHYAKEDYLAAGTTFEQLMELQPEEALWANNAGFNLRDASYDLEKEGQRFCRAASGALTDRTALAELRTAAGMGADDPIAGTPAEWPLFQAAGNETMVRARAIMERSSRAYDVAAELAPEDVRIVNDTGLVLVYYLQRDLVRAEQLLLACLDMGAEQVPAARKRLEQEDLSEEERADLEQELYDLEEAWGDAYQNLGVLELIHRKNPEKALAYFRRSVEIGPMDDAGDDAGDDSGDDSVDQSGVTIRTDVTNTLIPMARGEDVPENEYSQLPRWGKPCDG